MPQFTYIADILHDEYPQLDVCKNDGSALSILQWQCYGILTANTNDGVKISDSIFIDKASSFIDNALVTKASLVLTPEYSFPYEIIDKIINTPSLYPEKGKLWCLGSQGINIDKLKEKMIEWGKLDVIVINKAMELDEVKQFVSPLFYLFLSSSNKLCIVPQFKTGQMADARNSFEGAHLCFGKHIFVFNQQNSKNAFLSIICADVLHIDASDIKNNVNEEKIILFHPQLNPNPRNDDFLNFRSNLFRGDDKEIRIITLNWAEGTKCLSYSFDMPWSAFYKKQALSLENPSFRYNKENNHKKGTAYISNNHIDIWFCHRNEHCKLFYICKGDNSNRADIAVHRDEPVTEKCYVYEDVSWVEKLNLCCTNIKILNNKFAVFNSPYPRCNNCDKCEKSDIFFGSLLGHFEEGEMLCRHEEPSRILVGSDSDNDSKERSKKYQLLLELQELIKTGEFPEELKYLKNNNKFELSKYYSTTGGEIYNIVPINPPFNDSQALVAIVDLSSESDIDKIWKKLSDKLHERYRDQILLYHRVIGNGYRYYGKYLSQTKFNDSSFSKNPASIKKANSILRMFRR